MPIHARHVDVGEHRGVASFPPHPSLQRFDAIVHGVGRNAEQLELTDQNFAIHRMIVCDQDTPAGIRSLR